MERLTSLAFVARTVDYGEADRVCTLLTQQLGRVSALARSARRSRKRFGGALALFVLGEATLQPPRRGELLLLERFDAQKDLSGSIGADLVKVAHGSYLLEIARELWPAGQQEEQGFQLLYAGLEALARNPPSPPLLRAYELQLLAAMGLNPMLDRCVGCGAPDPDDGWFDELRGGALCQRCGPGQRPLGRAARRVLVQLAATPLVHAPAVRVERATARQCRELMLGLIRHHVGKELQSLRFLMQIPREPRGR